MLGFPARPAFLCATFGIPSGQYGERRRCKRDMVPSEQSHCSTLQDTRDQRHAPKRTHRARADRTRPGDPGSPASRATFLAKRTHPQKRPNPRTHLGLRLKSGEKTLGCTCAHARRNADEAIAPNEAHCSGPSPLCKRRQCLHCRGLALQFRDSGTASSAGVRPKHSPARMPNEAKVPLQSPMPRPVMPLDVRPALRPVSIPGLFVTGTDTGVGKTVVAGAIADWFRRKGARVAVSEAGRDRVRSPAGGAGQRGCGVSGGLRGGAASAGPDLPAAVYRAAGAGDRGGAGGGAAGLGGGPAVDRPDDAGQRRVHC